MKVTCSFQFDNYKLDNSVARNDVFLRLLQRDSSRGNNRRLITVILQEFCPSFTESCNKARQAFNNKNFAPTIGEPKTIDTDQNTSKIVLIKMKLFSTLIQSNCI